MQSQILFLCILTLLNSWNPPVKGMFGNKGVLSSSNGSPDPAIQPLPVRTWQILGPLIRGNPLAPHSLTPLISSICSSYSKISFQQIKLVTIKRFERYTYYILLLFEQYTFVRFKKNKNYVLQVLRYEI